MSIVYFWLEATGKLNSELSWSCWILNSLIIIYSVKFISHVASKHTLLMWQHNDSWSYENMKIEYFLRFSYW